MDGIARFALIVTVAGMFLSIRNRTGLRKSDYSRERSNATATELEKQIKDLYAALNAHDVERLLSFSTDDVKVVLLDGTVIRGKEELGVYMKRLFATFPDFSWKLTSFFASGDRQCEEYVVSGTHKGDFMGIPATGKSVSLRQAMVRELREGRSSRISSYYDSASILRQLGVLPPTPQS